MSIEKLIERLEKASAPDRYLNAEIYFALHPSVRDGWNAPNGVGPEGYYARVSPRYTESTDAAQSLVPDGHGWTVNSDGTARVWNADRAFYGLHANGDTARQPAIALSIAALRATKALLGREQASG